MAGDSGSDRLQQGRVAEGAAQDGGRIRAAGATHTVLEPGKRGKYSLVIFDMAGWDPARDKEITLEDPCPERITIEVVDRDSGAPLEGVNLIMHP